MTTPLSDLGYFAAVLLTGCAGLGGGIIAWNLLSNQGTSTLEKSDAAKIVRERNPVLRQKITNPFNKMDFGPYYRANSIELNEFSGRWCVFQWRGNSQNWNGEYTESSVQIPSDFITAWFKISSAGDKVYSEFSEPMIPPNFTYASFNQPVESMGIKEVHDLSIPFSDKLALNLSPVDDGDPFDGDDDISPIGGTSQANMIRNEDMSFEVVSLDPSGTPVTRLRGYARRCSIR